MDRAAKAGASRLSALITRAEAGGWDRSLGTATSASWKVTYHPNIPPNPSCRPILGNCERYNVHP